MENHLILPNVAWYIKDLTSIAKFGSLCGPSVTFMDMKWKLKLYHVWEEDKAKYQLTIERLSLPQNSKICDLEIQTSIEVKKGSIGYTKTTSLKVEYKEWNLWSATISELRKVYGSNIERLRFLIIIKPKSMFLMLPRTVDESDSCTCNNSDCLKRLIADFGKLFSSDDHSDVVLKCGDKSLRAHKAILSARSDYFAAMFSSDMKEARENVVKIENIEPGTLQDFLRYLYIGKFWNRSINSLRKLYAVADMYLVDALKQKCVLLFMENYALDDELITSFGPSDDWSRPTDDWSPRTSDWSRPTNDWSRPTNDWSCPPHDRSYSEQEQSKEDIKNKLLLKDLFKSREWGALLHESPQLAHDMCKSLLNEDH